VSREEFAGLFEQKCHGRAAEEPRLFLLGGSVLHRHVAPFKMQLKERLEPDEALYPLGHLLQLASRLT